MKKRLKKKMLAEYNCEWRADTNYGRPIPLRSEREEKELCPVTYMDWAKFVRRNYYNPPYFNRIRHFLAEYILCEEFVGSPDGEIRSGHRFAVYNRNNGMPLSSEEYREFFKLIGRRWLPYELGKILVANGTISQGEDILPDLPPDDDDWEGEWDDLPPCNDDCEFSGTVY